MSLEKQKEVGGDGSPWPPQSLHKLYETLVKRTWFLILFKVTWWFSSHGCSSQRCFVFLFLFSQCLARVEGSAIVIIDYWGISGISISNTSNNFCMKNESQVPLKNSEDEECDCAIPHGRSEARPSCCSLLPFTRSGNSFRLPACNIWICGLCERWSGLSHFTGEATKMTRLDSGVGRMRTSLLTFGFGVSFSSTHRHLSHWGLWYSGSMRILSLKKCVCIQPTFDKSYAPRSHQWNVWSFTGINVFNYFCFAICHRKGGLCYSTPH